MHETHPVTDELNEPKQTAANVVASQLDTAQPGEPEEPPKRAHPLLAYKGWPAPVAQAVKGTELPSTHW